LRPFDKLFLNQIRTYVLIIKQGGGWGERISQGISHSRRFAAANRDIAKEVKEV
jgi:hypothetical protein